MNNKDKYMKQSSHRSGRAYSGRKKPKRKFRIKWFDRFKRFDEFGFVNPEYDKTNLVMGQITFWVVAVAFVVLLVMAYYESFPRQDVY